MFLLKFQFQLILVAEKIGGNYFMKYNPDTFFERTMTRLNPWIDQPSALGGDFKSGMFTDSYGA